MSSYPSPSPFNIHPSRLSLQEVKPATITKIESSQSDLDELKKVLQSQRMGYMAKETRQREIVGICHDCGSIPDYIITRYYEGLQKIERYCAKCIDQEQEQEQTKCVG